MKNAKLKNLFCLSSKIAVYVPSTLDVDKAIDNKVYVNNISSLLASTFGGSTCQSCIGSYVSDNGNMINEPVNIVYSYCTTEQLEVNADIIITACEALKVEMNQESIALEINNKLYFI